MVENFVTKVFGFWGLGKEDKSKTVTTFALCNITIKLNLLKSGFQWCFFKKILNIAILSEKNAWFQNVSVAYNLMEFRSQNEQNVGNFKNVKIESFKIKVKLL